MKPILTFIVALGGTLPGAAEADSFTPGPGCSKPSKPFEFRDELELNDFLARVERYRDCINAFIERQADEMEVHRRSAEEAAEEWERYVRRELN